MRDLEPLGSPAPLLPGPLLEHVLRRAKGPGEFADIYLELRSSHAMSSDAGKVERVLSGLQQGAGLRVVRGGVTIFAYSEDLSEGALLELAAFVCSAARSAPAREAKAVRTRAPAALSPSLMLPAEPEVPLGAMGRAARIAVLQEADATARAVDPRITQVTTFVGTVAQAIQIANTDGLHAWDRRDRIRLRVQAIARNPQTGELAVGTSAPGATGGWEFLRQHPVAEVAQRAAQQAIVQLEAVSAPAGVMPVVLGPGVGGVMVHEACGHALEADLVVKGASVFAGRLGERVASSCVTIVDNSTVPTGWGSFAIDDEGLAARPTALVENGILRAFLTDRATGGRLGYPLTGNGRRASFRHLPLPRMTNTFIAPGSLSADEIIAATALGLYAVSFSGGSVNPATGEFQFTVREGYMIRNGRIAEPVRGAAILGRAPEVWSSVDLIANDLQFGAGNCGKDGQKAMVGIGQPTVRIRELLVGGASGRLKDESEHFDLD